ncbi:MAG: hypothetical protein NVS1B12_07930 [Acidimicrobiales bacterium]
MVTPEEGSFLTHANYIRALASEAGSRLFASDKKALEHLAGRVALLPSIADARPPKVDLDQVHRSLTIAWGTELLLALSGRYIFEDEVVRLANNWAVVQAYYILYHATQALVVAKGFPRPDSHPKTQNQFISLWVDRPLDLSPWSLGASSGETWRNCPTGKAIDRGVHVWTACTPTTQLSLAAKAYRTTRDDTVTEVVERLRQQKRTERRKAWLAEEGNRLAKGRKPRIEPSWPKPQLSAAERSVAESKVRNHSLIHYLYRLRIKTNYVDSAMFTDGPSDDASSSTVHRDLRYLAGASLLVHELHIAQLVGPSRLRGWADDWIAANAPAGGKPVGIQLRRPLL